MIVRTKILKQTHLILVAMATFFVSSILLATPASAVATVLVEPYDNLSMTSPSTLTITGAGLVPGAEIDVRQAATKGYDTGTTSGVYVEQLRRGGGIVDSMGNVTLTITVNYDVRTDAPYTNITECNNRDNTLVTRQSCKLEFRYMSNYGTADSFIGTQLLYFGMADPNGPPPPPPAPVEPVNNEDCKADKWSDFTWFGFKNQGECVSFVANKR